jgi:chemotaxis protein CheD
MNRNAFHCQRNEPDRTFIKAGFGYVPASPAKLWSVVGSSIVVTLYDHALKIGGMAHYSQPYRVPDQPSTTHFAAPALFWLIRQMMNRGAQKEQMEAQLIGGGFNEELGKEHPQLHEGNIKVGMEIIRKEGIKLTTVDVGGERGRKIMFNTATGESLIAHVVNIRKNDWYPPLSSGA